MPSKASRDSGAWRRGENVTLAGLVREAIAEYVERHTAG
jgi:hypothetical protein